jgi:hypothetical protein
MVELLVPSLSCIFYLVKHRASFTFPYLYTLTCKIGNTDIAVGLSYFVHPFYLVSTVKM